MDPYYRESFYELFNWEIRAIQGRNFRPESHLDIFKLINIGIGMKRMKRKYFEFLRNLQIEREA